MEFTYTEFLLLRSIAGMFFGFCILLCTSITVYNTIYFASKIAALGATFAWAVGTFIFAYNALIIAGV